MSRDHDAPAFVPAVRAADLVWTRMRDRLLAQDRTAADMRRAILGMARDGSDPFDDAVSWAPFVVEFAITTATTPGEAATALRLTAYDPDLADAAIAAAKDAILEAGAPRADLARVLAHVLAETLAVVLASTGEGTIPIEPWNIGGREIRCATATISHAGTLTRPTDPARTAPGGAEAEPTSPTSGRGSP